MYAGHFLGYRRRMTDEDLRLLRAAAMEAAVLIGELGGGVLPSLDAALAITEPQPLTEREEAEVNVLRGRLGFLYLRNAMQHALYWLGRLDSPEAQRLANAEGILDRALAGLYDGTTTLAAQGAPRRDVVPVPFETIRRLEAKVTQLEAALMATGGQSFANVFEPLGERCGYDLGEGLGQCQNLPTQVIRMQCPVCDEHADVEQFPVGAPPPRAKQ